MIVFTFLMVEFLEEPMGVADIAATEVVSPDSNCATASVVNAVIQNKLINVAVTTRLRLAIRFHKCIAVSISFFAQRHYMSIFNATLYFIYKSMSNYHSP